MEPPFPQLRRLVISKSSLTSFFFTSSPINQLRSLVGSISQFLLQPILFLLFLSFLFFWGGRRGNKFQNIYSKTNSTPIKDVHFLNGSLKRREENMGICITLGWERFLNPQRKRAGTTNEMTDLLDQISPETRRVCSFRTNSNSLSTSSLFRWKKSCHLVNFQKDPWFANRIT